MRQRLDLEAGLHEALLAEQHTALADKLRDTLDIEAGLAAIVPPDLTAVVGADEETEDEGSLEWASSALAVMPLPGRLILRERLADRLAAAARRTLECMGMQDDPKHRLMDVLLDIADVFVAAAGDSTASPSDRWRISVQGLELPPWPDHAANRDEQRLDPSGEGFDIVLQNGTGMIHVKSSYDSASQVSELINMLGRANREPDRSQGLAGTGWIGACEGYLVEVLKCAVRHIEEPTKQGTDKAEYVTETLNMVASHLSYLEQMLNDFRGVDLRKVDLAGIDLGGVRWSDATTQWPEHWIEEIRRDSVHLGDGVWEINYGTRAHRDSLV
ncbi:hypothetical protein [Nocardia brasiliensis]|uniref:hypothetical protein n=1 Tax=Nocardia brasiliensis TaxID=37326 RepID=UPI00366FE092